MFNVKYSDGVFKQLSKMDKKVSSMIYRWIETNLIYCEDPRTFGKALTGEFKSFWRYRVGAYRIIAKIQDNELLIEIINVGHRRNIYH